MNYKEAFEDMNKDWFSKNEHLKEFWSRFLPEKQMITPTCIIEKMVNKANVDWKNPNLKICDPCCGSGRFLIYCLIKLLEAGHSEKHIIENMLYGTDIEQKCIDFTTIFWKFNQYKHNIKCSSILNKDWSFKDMTFDLIIMNPPYNKNLHLKILSKAIEHISDEGKVINLSPIRWLQDPLAKHKKNTDYHRFEESISKHIEDLEIIDNKKAEEQFNIFLYTNLGIYICNKIGGFNYKDIYKNNRSILELHIINKCVSLKDNLDNHIEKMKRDGIRVLIALIAGNRGNLPIYKDLSYVIDGNKNNKDWTECKNNGGYAKIKGSNIPDSIKFNTEIEAQNFYDSYNTIFSKWLCNVLISDQHIQPKFYPYMEDYTKPWDNKRFCDYFNITGYVSDTEAVPGSEWEEIITTMDKYK